MLRRLSFTAVLLCLIAAAPAQATTVVSQPFDLVSPVVVTGSGDADVVTLAAADGTLRVEDTAGVITTGLGAVCTADGPTAVECATWSRPKVALGAGNDHALVAPGWEGGAPEIHGDGGNDTVESGAAWLVFRGGGGTDTLSFARYSGRRLTARLGRTEYQGIEALEGSPQDDSLFGSGGGETIRGGEGDDYVDPGAGPDVVVAGGGDDDVHVVDGAADRIECGAGDGDEARVDAIDVQTGGCESWQGPRSEPPPSAAPAPAPPAAAPPAAAPRPAPRPTTPVTRPARGKRGAISILSRPAADAERTRIGARIGVPEAGMTLRMTVRHGDRRIGQSEVAVAEPGPVVIAVPLDAEVKRAVAQTRHVELMALIELESQSGAGVGEEYQATIVEPPPFVRGARGVRRRGGFGPQRLSGTRRGDHLRGESGDDVLRGLSGNDELDGGTGNDELLGSAGNDHLDGYDGDDVLSGGAGDDLIIESRFGDDTLSGGDGNDWIVGARGTDAISGGAGDDVIFGGSGSDRFDCGDGEDTVFVNLEIERRTASNCERILDEDDIPSIRCPDEGTADGETMLGSDGADVCKGHDGDDDVEGAGGSDQLFGGAGADRVFGRFGNDQMYGEDGDDELEGGRGEDRLSGGAGDDHLNGGFGRDRVDGGAGNDMLISRGGSSDHVDCGPGRDVVIADRSDRVTGCETIRRR